MWFSIVFGLGIAVFLVIQYITKLYRFKGTKLKTRMNYALAVSLFFTILGLWQTSGSLQLIEKGILLGLFLSPLLCVYSKKWTESKIRDTTISYKKVQRIKRLFWTLPIVILSQFLLHQDLGRQFVEAKWPMLGIALSWFISQMFVMSYIIKLERASGKPILEDEQ